MNPNHHERIRADLKAYVDGELSPLQRFFVARHLRACPSCREELIQMQTLSTELRESDPEISDAPLSTELRAHILENAPVTDADSPAEEPDFRSHRVARKKMILALGVTSILMFMIFTTLTGSKIHNTFNKAADSMNTTDDIVNGPSSGIFGGGGGAGSIAPTSIPGVSSNRAPVPMPHDSPSNLPMAANGIGNSTTSSAGAVTTNDANGMFSDGHVRSQIANETTTVTDGALSQRRGSADELRSADRAEQQSQFSVTLSGPSSKDVTVSVVPPTRAVHREGSISVAVQNAESAGDDAAGIVKNAGGFVANTSLETGTGQRRTAVLDCRVPVTQFETVVKKLSALGTVRSKSLSGQDITAQIAQSGARRQTLAQELAIAQTRLANKEKSRKPNADDLYQLRAEVRTIRIQASQARAALETLQKYGSLSSLYVTLQDGLPSATPHTTSWFDSLSPTTQAAWTSFLSNARLPLQLLLWVLAYSPLWLPALIIWHKYGRKWLTE